MEMFFNESVSLKSRSSIPLFWNFLINNISDNYVMSSVKYLDVKSIFFSYLFWYMLLVTFSE